MWRLRRILGFTFWSLIIYGLLVVPPHGLMDLYRAAFRGVGNVLFHSVGGAASVRFEKYSDAKREKDTTLRLTNRRTRAVGSVEIRANRIGYRPTAFLVGLILATPAAWRRKAWALVWGLPAVSLFVAFRCWLQIVDILSNPDVLNVYTLAPFWKKTLKMLLAVFVKAPEWSYIVPAIIWLIVAFRAKDWFGPQVSAEQPSSPRRAKKS